MYIRLLRKSAHTKTFTVSYHQPQGWVVHEEEDDHVIMTLRCQDWHRVERAMQTFASRAESLRKRGWTDHAIVDHRRPLRAGLRNNGVGSIAARLA